MSDGDLDRYVVVRVADEIVVDLMKAACGIEYAEASLQVDRVKLQGVEIPFANVKVIDEDGEDYLYPARWFVAAEVPKGGSGVPAEGVLKGLRRRVRALV